MNTLNYLEFLRSGQHKFDDYDLIDILKTQGIQGAEC